MKSINYKYEFKFEDGNSKHFEVEINPDNLNVILKSDHLKPEWAKLQNFKCTHCPLNSEEIEYCPVALNLVEIIDFFSEIPSFEKARIRVISENRVYEKFTDVQAGVSSLIGLLMASSGCPVIGKVKPLVKFHLPFASIEETEYKAFTMYLFAQYFKMQNGQDPDWEMSDLNEMYKNILILNQNVAQKISELEMKDTGINAVVVLNNFADSVTFNLQEQDLTHLQKLFSDFLTKG